MATTTNFGWETPDDTDLVKDGALAMRTLGNAIDTSLVDLKGGTTGQVLSKNSNTDMDFTWVTSDDANAIQNAIVDAKGDLITATAADTPARLAVGSNGDTLVADSSQSTGLRWGNNYGFTAGKNKIINGDFTINQRAFTSTTTTSTYGFDRFYLATTDGTSTYSAQTFTAGTAPVAGYEATNFARLVSSGQTLATAQTTLRQKIEDVRTLANQAYTVSFWAKAGSGTPSLAVEIGQNFGSGGSTTIVTQMGSKTAITTSWARYTFTATIPSIAGKTIGASNFNELLIWTSAGSNFDSRTGTLGIQSATIDIWGVQVEAGNVATAFQTATGTLQGELAACQRYYYRNTATGSSVMRFCNGSAATTTIAYMQIYNPVVMRVNPTAIEYGGTIALYDGQNVTNITTLTLEATGRALCNLQANVSSGLTQYRPYVLTANSDATAYIGLTAEL